MEEEIWKDVKDYEGRYQVSNLGRVKSLPRMIGLGYMSKEVVLSPSKNRKGYLSVNLHKDRFKRPVNIHKLVAMMFLDFTYDKSNGLVVDHINNVRDDNRLENLQIISQRLNNSKDRKGKSSKYIGVVFNRGRWKASIRVGDKSKHLGSFDNEEDAANAYQSAIKSLEIGDLSFLVPAKYSSSHRGVYFNAKSGKWMARMTVDGKGKYIGLFEFELDAKDAYTKAVEMFNKGENPFSKERVKSSKYKGVSFIKRLNKWKAFAVKNGKVVCFGYYKDEHEAYLAYLEGLEKLDNVSI